MNDFRIEQDGDIFTHNQVKNTSLKTAMLFIANNLTIRWQLLIICVLMVTVPTIILGILTYRKAKIETLSQIEERLGQQALMIGQNAVNVYNVIIQKAISDLRVAEIELKRAGILAVNTGVKTKTTIINQVNQETSVIDLPSLVINSNPLNQNFEVVDRIKELLGGTSTIFQLYDNKLIRISTNVVKQNGERAVGTYIPEESPVFQSIIKGEIYYGRAFVVNAWYMAAYKPIKDFSGNIIGAIFIGVNEKEFQNALLSELSKVVVGKTGYIFVIDQKGTYVLSNKRKRDGEIIWNNTDASGNLFIQDMVKKALSMKDTSYAIQYYPWKNTGDDKAKLKIAGLSYFKNWDWVIGASAYQEEFMDALRNIQRSTAIICLISILLGSIVAYTFAKYMSTTFNHLVSRIITVAQGDLTLTSEKNNGKNEIAGMTNAFGVMLENLKKLVSEISENSNITAATAEELSASTEEVNATTEQVSLSIDEIAKGSYSLSQSAAETKEQTDELITSIQSVASIAYESKKKASEVNSLASIGSISAKVATEKMNAIKTSVNTSGEIILELVGKSKKINDVVEVITNISRETNLLALNAAIEAARAGEAGKGFGVVAGAIRKLAEESQKSASLIAKMIHDVVKTVENASKIMQSSSSEVEESTKVVNEALSALENISQFVMELTNQIDRISNATEEQLRASEQVQEAVGTVSAVAEESAAASEEVATSIQETRVSMQQVAASAQELALNADQLRSLISRFKTLEKKKSDIKIETLYFKSMENKSRPTIASKNVAKKKVTLS